ncbi:SpoIIE family protein phosphatase [Rhodocaloribacter litoris]|uniref:PP2C family protein-serine/threonine phosphatase n=1 Tax=Rhodocaloribacter litoris TaxID=2558931 RepID=UPI001420D23F|nr:GAF domain-containing SpoIIE family protein phosphatase [Rhodocaloribacter litoris]QXD16694.1 SpoIIE family protein phosphatase [Rhodocaloribacter litoris]
MQYVLLGTLWGVCYVLALGYHLLLWNTGEPAGLLVEGVYHVVVLTGYAAFWFLLSLLFRHRRSEPGRIFWTTLLLGGLYVLLGYLVTRIPPVGIVGFSMENALPLAPSVPFKVGLLALLKTTFAFILLLRFRELVLVKRTRSSQRNWNLMIGFMVLAALSGFMRSPREEVLLLQGLAIIPAVVFMVVNSFRLSWIVTLSFRAKMATSGMAFLLLILLIGLAGIDGSTEDGFELVPGAVRSMLYYSYPLAIFTGLAVYFGILYCTTAFLSLLFHLPTTSDFQRKAGEMATMHSLSHLVSQVFDSEKLFTTIAASPIDACSAQASWLALPDLEHGTLEPRIVAAHGMTPERIERLVDVQALFDEVRGSRAPLVLHQALADHRVDARAGDGLGSLLVVPLLARDQVLGALFATKEVTHGFEQDDVEAISVFAAQAALALDNARLFEEQLEKERLARELAIARAVQRKLLPQRLPVLPGMTLAASSVSALEVGGDYYDFARLDDHRLAVIVADVSGKGTSAAFYMAEMQGIFQSVSRLAPSPCDFLHHANVALASSLEKNVFISVVYGVLDLHTEEFVLARAGHCPAAVISLNGSARYLRSRGLGLGLDRGPLFRKMLAEERIRLQPGDVFVLYTDGIVESRNAAGEEYGYDRLLRVLAEHRHEDATDLHAALLDDLNTFLGEKEYDDDMTLVVLKWHGIRLDQPGPVTGERRAGRPAVEQPAAGEVSTG